MYEGEELIRFEVLISKDSYLAFFKRINQPVNPAFIFDRFKEDFEIKKLSVSKAFVLRTTPQLYIENASNSSISMLRDWDKEEQPPQAAERK